MKKFLIPVLFLLLSQAHPALADALCNSEDSDKAANYLKQAKLNEKAGRNLEALLYYKTLNQFCGNEEEARQGIMRVGSRLASKAVSKGQLFSGTGIFRLVPDVNCRKWLRYIYVIPNPNEPAVPGMCTAEHGGMRVELDENAGAFEIYQATYNYREADQMMLKRAMFEPRDILAYESVVKHFNSRKELRDRHYSIDPAMLSELNKLAEKGVDRTLSDEDSDFADARDVSNSFTYLETAMRWASFAGKASEKKVLSRAVQRGDEALRSNSPEGLMASADYYEFAGELVRKKDALAKAEDLGASALKANDPVRALNFFSVSGNQKMIEQARDLVEKATRSKTPGTEIKFQR